MTIRHAERADLDALAAMERASYPISEGASKETIRARLERFPSCFWLTEDETDEPVAFICGMHTDCRDLTDEMYDHPELYRENGSRLMIFSVVTAPDRRGEGLATALMEQVIAEQRAEGRAEIVLTAKEKLLGFYARFGFVNEGVSASVHGNAVWYQMRLSLV